MDRKKLMVSLVAVCLVSVLAVGLFQFGFQLGVYERDGSLSLDVGTCSMHVTVHLQRVGDPMPVYWDHHAGTLTTIGKNWIEDQMGDSPSTDPAKWVSVSLDGGAPAAGWTEIPAEIVADGLSRAAGTYASTGDGVWTIIYQFTASDTHVDVQLTGLQWADAGDGNLLGADTFTPVTLNNGDKLTVTWTITVT